MFHEKNILYYRRRSKMSSFYIFVGVITMATNALESEFQAKVVKEIRKRLPGAIVIKNDSGYLQGYPDWSVHYHGMFALLEIKRHYNSHKQPNQDYYINQANAEGGFGRFVHQENKDVILDEMERSFKTSRIARVSKPE